MSRAKASILVVDDEKDLVAVMRQALRKEGYRVLAAGSGEAALTVLRREAPDLVILDVSLPRMDGFETAQAMRRETSAPILFLSARSDTTDRVVGLKVGGDDYVPKPFAMRELLARVEALLRRSRPSAFPEEGARRFGVVLVDFGRRRLEVRGKAVHVPAKEFELLRLLAGAKGKVLSREAILEKVWGVPPEAEIATRSVDQHVAKLRRRLGPERERLETVAKVGYRFRTE